MNANQVWDCAFVAFYFQLQNSIWKAHELFERGSYARQYWLSPRATLDMYPAWKVNTLLELAHVKT